MTADWTVRPRRDTDIDPLAEILPVIHETDGYPVRASSCTAAFLDLPDGARAWVVDQDGVAVGHAALLTGPHTGIPSDVAGTDPVGALGRLFIAPSARGRGQAVALVEAVCAEARADGLVPMLEVVDGTPAVTFYERHGWILVGSGPTTWTGDDGQHRTVRYYREGPAAAHGAN